MAASISPAHLRELFSAARRSGKRAKDAAESLGVSEGQAIAAHTAVHEHGLQATPLHGPWVEVLQALQLCGPVMALTRNESTVHEKTGVYENISASGHMGLALGEDIDLRLFFGRWHAGFAVYEPASQPKNPPSQSLQFFDAHGVAVHKVFVRAETDRAAFNDIVSQFSEGDKTCVFTPAPPKPIPKPDAELDAAGLAQGWSEMTDTHQFFGLISRFGVERQQAFRLVEGRFTERAEPGIVRVLLDEAAFDGTSIMVFVSSSGCIQIHSGPVRRIEPMVTATARWLNVLDAGFSLHLREDMIENAWIVKKPTADGVVTSVEIFDARGELMAMFFGSRKPGVPEQQAWRDIAARLPRLPNLQS
ncbi:ChuX/HutX family heme-like substrate-binding protein [Polaromonas hydrogenivorans]|uniref:ChuX/HutX family heme-like substrate-binding protein n=2 Tax=Polaromonas hydrogenivorans TaxID=335476 RepID=A0AAU7LZ79_9BURK